MPSRISSCNYQAGFYQGDKPYRDRLVDALKYFGFTAYQNGEEFWTLGGKEWHEYRDLVGQGIKFGPGSYCNVDWMQLDELNDSAVRPFSNADFFDIHKYWSRPKAICYDSTRALVDRNTSLWVRFVGLALEAAKISGAVSANWNFLKSYGPLTYDKNEDDFYSRYIEWMEILADHCDYRGFGVEFYRAMESPKEDSQTVMVSGHCKIIKRQGAENARLAEKRM